MKVEPVSFGTGFLLALVLVQVKKFMDSRKEGFCGCGAAV